jgi:two-component system response regulator NreC
MEEIKIALAINSSLIYEGIKAILSENKSIRIVSSTSLLKALNVTIKEKQPNILICESSINRTEDIELIKKIAIRFYRTRVLVISMQNNNKLLFNTIKAGAKGILTYETDKDELIEAIYTLRNGYDYYSKSISHFLINNYINQANDINSKLAHNRKKLTDRELEIVKLWGEGLTNTEMAEKLFISIRTVESHKNHIMQKLNFKTTVDLIKFAIKNNIINL